MSGLLEPIEFVCLLKALFQYSPFYNSVEEKYSDCKMVLVLYPSILMGVLLQVQVRSEILFRSLPDALKLQAVHN